MINNASTTSYNLPQASNPFSKFSNVDYSNNQSYLTQAYSNRDNQEYYTDIVDIENKAKKKKKRNTLIAISTTLIGIGAVVGAFATSKYVSFDKITKAVHNVGEAVQNAGEAAGNTKIGKQAIGLFDRFANSCANFTTVKDAAWKKVENLPFMGLIKKGGQKFSNLYRDIFCNGSYKKISRLLGGDDEANKVISALFTNGKTPANGKDVLKGVVDDLSGVFEDGHALDVFSGKGVKGAIDTFTNTTIRNDVVNEKIKFADLQNKLNELAKRDKLISDKKEQLLNIFKDEFMPKAGDIANGCAPTDLITAGIPIAAFGVAVAGEEDKEEQKSLLLNLGIPLLPTCLMPFVGLKFPILNGFRGMAAGLAVGQVVKRGVIAVDKFIKKSKNNDTQKA